MHQNCEQFGMISTNKVGEFDLNLLKENMKLKDEMCKDIQQSSNETSTEVLFTIRSMIERFI
jgi:hypothetical protein